MEPLNKIQFFTLFFLLLFFSFGCIQNTIETTPTLQACRGANQACAQTTDCCESLICLNYVCTTAPNGTTTTTPTATPTTTPTIESSATPSIQATITSTPTAIATSTPNPSPQVSSEELKIRVDSFSQKYHNLGYNNESSCIRFLNSSNYTQLVFLYGPPIRNLKDAMLAEEAKINSLVDELKSFDDYNTNKETIIIKISEILNSSENYKGNCSYLIYGYGTPPRIAFDDSDLRYVNCTLMGTGPCTFTSPTPIPTTTPTATPTPTPIVCPDYSEYGTCVSPSQSYVVKTGCPTPVICTTPTPTPTVTPYGTQNVNGVIVTVTFHKMDINGTIGQHITIKNNGVSEITISDFNEWCTYPMYIPYAMGCVGVELDLNATEYPPFNYRYVGANIQVDGWARVGRGIYDYLESYNTNFADTRLPVNGTVVHVFWNINDVS